MVLCDTNIFINAFNGRADTIDQLSKIGLGDIVLSSITVMELFQGMATRRNLPK
jgi:predicted nucleic acid-binding protein